MFLEIGDLTLDPAEHAIRRGKSGISLTRTEFALLETLMRNAGRVVTRDRLLEAVWGNEREIESNTLDVFMRQLRSKIDPPGSVKLIHTIRGVGYALREEEEDT
jgi:two-component system response regulator MprA